MDLPRELRVPRTSHPPLSAHRTSKSTANATASFQLLNYVNQVQEQQQGKEDVLPYSSCRIRMSPAKILFHSSLCSMFSHWNCTNCSLNINEDNLTSKERQVN